MLISLFSWTFVPKMKGLDEDLLAALKEGNYSGALSASQANLHYFVGDVMNLTNIYEFTFDENYLTNHEYVCFLEQPHVRRSIHVGGVPFRRGLDSYRALRNAIMVTKKPWLEDILERGRMEVLPSTLFRCGNNFCCCGSFRC